MSVSTEAICLKHTKINMRKLWLCVLGLPVVEEPRDTAAQCSSLSGFVGGGWVTSLREEGGVTNRLTRHSVQVGADKRPGLRIVPIPLPSSSSHSLWIQSLRVSLSLSSVLLKTWGLQVGYSLLLTLVWGIACPSRMKMGFVIQQTRVTC